MIGRRRRLTIIELLTNNAALCLFSIPLAILKKVFVLWLLVTLYKILLEFDFKNKY
jgi:hypothetical protein